MRKSNLFLLYLAINITLLALLFGHAFLGQKRDAYLFEKKKEIVHEYRLTDLCLFTEASYTRHPAVADRHAPFQDGPMSFEHFPSGSILPPPVMRKR
jgi:hypothetical protein